MKFKKRGAAAVAVAAIMACGALAGCDGLTTGDARKDYEQIVADVNIARSADFEEGGKYADYKEVFETAEITKRDLVSMFASQGGSLVNSGYSYSAIFDSICDSLINRQVYLQYAQIYYFTTQPETYGKEGYKSAIADARAAAEANGYSAERTALAADIAGLAYFLDEEEEGKARYDLKVSVNEALDSQEESIIAAADEDDSDEEVRTLPTGVNTEDEDYYTADYAIYTGTGSRNVSMCGEYEPVEGSTVTTRKKAYTQFLNNLRSYALLFDGEDTSEIENLVYYSMEVKNAYESALLEKLSDSFEEEAEAIIAKKESADADWVEDQFNKQKASQQSGYADDAEGFETALDGMSDSSFILTAPEAHYGFVINILLPFSTAQSQELKNSPIDSGDKKGNKFAQRASILEDVLATDQRATWFTGEEDYSFETEEGFKGDLGNAADRTYLFFEDCLAGADGATGAKYDALKNYYGQYTYNGKVSYTEEDGDKKYTFKPYKIGIADFMQEMVGYLQSATYGEENTALNVSYTSNPGYNQGGYYYAADGDGHKAGDVDYTKFVYGEGAVTGNAPFDANKMFVRGSWENTAFSVINELSFAYNTDTAGLNTYLGYAVTPGKTDFVSEFEYAAQTVCEKGAGNFIVVPSDYGWHVIYCTFSFPEAGVSPFTYVDGEKKEEGTFSYLFYENLKEQSVSTYTSNKQTQIVNTYMETCSNKYEDRYADLTNLG